MIKKQIHLQFKSRLRFAGRWAGAAVTGALSAILSAALSVALVAAAASLPRAMGAQETHFPVPGASSGAVPGAETNAPAPALELPPLPAATPITPNGTVVEDVIARINDQIITRSEYERAEKQLVEEARQQNAPESEVEDKLHNLLRDMIDQQLLLSKGKELGITGDAETMRRLDDIRKQNHLDSMQALQKAAEAQGVSFEDFKQQIKNSVITNQVVQNEVGRHLDLTHAEEVAYYNAHAQQFEVPEQVHLSEILIVTPDNATDAQLDAAQQKADAVEAKLKAGANFAETAKADSGGPTASVGGDLGDFKRGTLGDVLEKATFSLPVGGFTAPIRTRQGFVILRVDSHQKAGIPPLSAVEQQVEEAIYFQQLQPALRAYLTKAREDAYIDIKPGFIDTGASRKETKPTFTAYAPPPIKKKVLKKERVEQEKARLEQEHLAAEREKLAEKQEENEARRPGGGRNASYRVKRHKIHREKIRFGQAPRKALPAAATQTAESTGTGLQGQTAGAAMAPTDTVTSISTGTGFDENSRDELAPKPGSHHKVRYSALESESAAKHEQEKLSRAEAKASARPIAATPQETETEKLQAAPLGLNGNTAKHKKKKHKHKHVKGEHEQKERLQDKTKPVETPQPIAPTVNPDLGGVPAATPAATPGGQSGAAGSAGSAGSTSPQ